MSAADFASFLEKIGHRVVRTRSSCWYDAGRFFYLSLPSHQLLSPEPDELRELWRTGSCAGVRFPAPLEGPGKLSYQIVCSERGYSLDTLSANNRSKVRRGLRRCEVGPLAFAEIARLGERAHRDTLARQERDWHSLSQNWQRYFEAAAQTPGMEGWAAFAHGELAAFLVSVQFDDTVEFLLARSRSDMRDAYPNNALLFHVAEEMLVRRGVRQITFGLESLEEVESLDEFKFGMGFQKKPLRQRVVFHPWLAAVIGLPGLNTLLQRWAARGGASSVRWRKAAGLLRFAAEGRA